MLLKYLFILFLDNIWARIYYPSYETSLNLTKINFPGIYHPIHTSRNRLHIEDMKFIIRVGGMTFKTVGILSSGEVYLARLFTHGNPIRTIRVVNGTSTDNAPVIFNGDGKLVSADRTHTIVYPSYLMQNYKVLTSTPLRN
ncbi:hypothetical protein KSF78_0009533 [Schistosoma japonicum]|nr:hypothetical protein KSF78_0009533 [Schistosoma japonicum]